MSATTLTAFIHRCRVLCQRHSPASDGELLRRFVARRDEAAFEQLLERHAALVWGVCRRILPSETDCEDVFQAAFLALARQAGSLDPNQPLGGWLHTVAVRVARKARDHSARQLLSAILPDQPTAGDVADDVSSRELCRIVDEEMVRLPSTFRIPIILCCLQGRTRDEAAEMLGCSVAAVRGRLERGRALLKKRLASRGISLPAAFLVLSLTAERIRASLGAKTVQSALRSPSPTVAALADAGLRSLAVGKWKLVGWGLASLLLMMGAASAVGRVLTTKPPETPAAKSAEAKKAATPRIRTDRHGDPLPDGALARLGTVRWRHGDFVHALEYSPDGKRIVSTGVGRALVLWDAATGKELRVFSVHGQPRGVAFSPDGKTIATTFRTGQLWDADNGKMLRELPNGQNPATALAFAPDGKTLATANADNALYLWNPATGEKKRRIDCGQGGVNALAYSPDGTTLATGGTDGTIHFWDAATGKERRRFSASKKFIWSLVFSPDGKHLASASDSDAPRLWDVATRRELRALGDKQTIFAPLAFSPDGKWLATGYADGTLRLWDAASGEEKRHWYAGAGLPRSLAFSPDSQTLASAVLWDGGIRLWDVATGRERSADEGHHGPVRFLRFADDNKTLISAGLDRRIRWWDVANQTPRRGSTWTTRSFNAFALSSDGNTLAVGDRDTNEVWLWDIRTGKAAKLPAKQENRIQTVAFSPDGRLVASAGRDGAIHLCDVREGKEVRQIKGFTTVVTNLIFSPDGRMLVHGPSLRAWDVASGEERRIFTSAAGDAPAAFSADGKVLATVNDPPNRREKILIRLWDTKTGKEMGRYGGHRLAAWAVAISPDGKLVASGEGTEEDNSIHIWEAATGRRIRRYEGHHSWVFAVTFATDGLTVASGAGDSTVLLWDITGQRSDGQWHGKPLTPRQLEACWTALGGEDTTKAYDAVWAFVAASKQAVPFLAKQLPPVQRPDAKTVARLIADLNSEEFLVRRNATTELGKYGETIVPDLRRTLEGKPTLETSRRVRELLDRTQQWNAARLRDHRAIQALEHIATPKADAILRTLAAGVPGARRTEEAKAALKRRK